MSSKRRIHLSLFILIILVACNTKSTLLVTPTLATEVITQTVEATSQVETPVITPTVEETPACYQTVLPQDIDTSYAVQGWREFSVQAGFDLQYFYFPVDCTADDYERDAQRILYGNVIPEGDVGLVILNPIGSGILGALYTHLIRYEYWQMGPEDYPAVLGNGGNMSGNLIFLRVNELNGDETIIGAPLDVMTSLAEHEYIHIVQHQNNPELAAMVWADKDYQAFIEGYANIGNLSSQRYYFETQAALEIMQNLDLENRSNVLQNAIAAALVARGLDTDQFKATTIKVYDRHILAFYLRVAGENYLELLNQGEISPWLLFCRAGSGDLIAYDVIKSILK